MESLGLRVSKSEVSRIARGLDEQVEAFRCRPLEGRYPYLFLDAKVEKVRAGGRVVRKCVVIAHGVHDTGRREVIGLDVGEAETEAFWRAFLRSLVAASSMSSSRSPTPTQGSRRRSRRCSAAPGSAARSTSCGTAWATPAASSSRCWPP